MIMRETLFLAQIGFIFFALGTPAIAQDNVAVVVSAAPGRIEGAGPIVSLGAAGTGVIRELLVTEGDHVKAGQLLLRLNCDPLDQESRVAAAKLKLAEAQFIEAEKTFQRSTALQGTITRARIDETERDYRVTQAQVEQAREEANWVAARLNDCSIKAPTNGVVLSTLAMPGQFVSASAPTPLIKFVDDGTLRVRAEVDERDLNKICPRQAATVTADGFPGVSFPAHVLRINPGMGRRTVLSGDPAEKSDRDVREVILGLDRHSDQWPIDLRVVVLFQSCSKSVAGNTSPSRPDQP